MSENKLNWSHGDDYFSRASGASFEKVFQGAKKTPAGQQSELERQMNLELFDYDSEYYETLRDNILIPYEGQQQRPSIIALTSSDFNEGVSTITSKLAVTCARREEAPVLLVDSNFAMPDIHNIFGLDNAPGFGEVLLENYDYHSVIKQSPIKNLFILTAGDIHINPTAKFDSPRFAEIMQQWRKEFKLVLFDTPPMQCDMKQCDMNSSVRLASLVDGVVMVIQSEYVRREVAQRMSERLKLSNSRILGVVLNKKKYYIPEWLYRRL